MPNDRAGYRIGRLKGRYVVTWRDAQGNRKRYRLDASTPGDARREAPGLVDVLTRPQGASVDVLWDAFTADRAGRAIIPTMRYTWKALRNSFTGLTAEQITIEHCRAYRRDRERASIKPGTIATELGHLRMVLRWAEKRGLIARAPAIERPSGPKRRDVHLTRAQCRALIGAATMPHLRLFIVLALATGARNAALLGLTWARCDFQRGLIDLRDAGMTMPHKGRAIVPMNRSARAALIEAREGALSDHVIEWAGGPVGSVKRGLKSCAAAAGITSPVSPHIFRHSAAVHMAEAGIPMDEIAQYLGHENVEITRRVYARFSPIYLRRAAEVLNYDDLGSTNQAGTTSAPPKTPELPAYVVGATGIEPVTPTMSTMIRRRK